MPFFSIVVPTLNRASELERCVDSVLGQSFQDWELLIVDDGSNDSTSELISSYQEKDKRILFISRPLDRKQGGNTCRNIGIERANGLFISFLDSDDAFGKGRLESIFQFVNQNKNSKAFYSGAIKVSDSGYQINQLSRQILEKESLFDFIFSDGSFVQTSTFVVSSNIASRVKFDENLRRHQDYDFFIRLGLNTSWKVLDNAEVFIYSGSYGFKKIDFNSCAMFYEKYKYLSDDNNIKKKYLTYISESCAKLNPNMKVMKYYNHQFIVEKWKRSTRQIFLFKFPYLFHYIYRLKLIVKG